MEPDLIDEKLWTKITASVGTDTQILQSGWLNEGDSYYYEHHNQRRFPVYRIIVDDAGETHYYLDAVSGRMLDKMDGNRQWYRWLFNALHSWNFTALFRTRPFWDGLMLLLLCGATTVCMTGFYMGVRRYL